jgi:hypothetical protein
VSIFHFKNLELFLSIFFIIRKFLFLSTATPEMYESLENILVNCYFLQCNGMWGMIKLEKIVVTNETTHCKLKQGSKIVFQLKYFT